jgi:hypothetical protein
MIGRVTEVGRRTEREVTPSWPERCPRVFQSCINSRVVGKRRKEPTEWTTEKCVPTTREGGTAEKGGSVKRAFVPSMLETATVVSRHVAVRHTKER